LKRRLKARDKMKKSSGGAALAIKAALCLVAATIAIFFVVQASLGARDAVESPSRARDIATGKALYDSLKGILEVLSSSRVFSLVPIWELALGGEVFLEEEDGVLYLTSNLGQVRAVEAASGRTIWNLDLGVWVSAPPAVKAGVVYVGTTDHVLYCLDAGSGALLWYYTAQGEILAQPVVNGDMVFITADNDSVYDLLHRLYALDARSGTPIWIYDTESWTPSPPAVGEDAVYLGGYRREVYALDKKTGEELWSFKASNIVFSSPQISGEQVLFACIDGWVYALDAADGSSLWSRKLPGFVWLAPLDGSDNLYACSHRNTLNAMALQNGEELWSFTNGDLLSCSTLTDKAAVCAFRADGKSYLLDAATGKSLGILEAPYGFASSPLLVGQTIYAGSPDGFVRAYVLPDEMR
jgi:eukaryotic-like serine/threonine-protein kinase